MLIQPSYADTVAVADDTVLGLSDPATVFAPMGPATVYQLTVQIDLGAVHLDPDAAGGDAQFGAGVFLVPSGDPAPTVQSSAALSSRPMWFTRNLAGVGISDTRRATYPLGAVNFALPVTLDYGSHDLYLGIGSVFGNDLIGVTVPVFTPNGFVTLQYPDGNGGFVS